MEIVLHVTGEANDRKRLWLRQNQEVRVGRSDWADFTVGGDPSLADVHFKVACHREACWLTDLSHSPGTYVNGVRVVERTLAHGDAIRAGRTRFDVAINIHPARSVAYGPVPSPVPAASPMFRYRIESSGDPLIAYRSLAGSCGPEHVVRALMANSHVYFVVNFRRAGLPVASQRFPSTDLLAGLPSIVRSYHSLEMFPVSELFPVDQFMGRMWGRDAVSVICSSLTAVDLAANLRHAAPCFLSTGLLRRQLLTAPAPYVQQLFAGVQAVVVEANASGSWVVFAERATKATWQDLGFPDPPTA